MKSGRDQILIAAIRSAFGRVAVRVAILFSFLIFVVAACSTADVQSSWRPGDLRELSFLGQNLVDDHHPDQARPVGLLKLEVPRGCYIKLTRRT